MWTTILIAALAFAGCSSSSTPSGQYQIPCNTGTSQTLANPTAQSSGAPTNVGAITIVAFGNNNILYTSYNQWIVTMVDNTGMAWTGGPLRLVSDPSGPHPYPSDFYYASNIPMLTAGRTYQVSISEPSSACVPQGIGAFST